MPIKLENVQITSYQLDALDNNASTGAVDRFVFQPQSSERAALQPYMEFKLNDVLISGVIQNGDGADGSTGGLAVDPTNPNTEVDGRDFLIWQRGNATPGPDDNVDDGLLLPAVQGLLLPAVQHESMQSTGDGSFVGGVYVAVGDIDGNATTGGARVPPHTPEWTGFNSGDPGLLLPTVQGLLLPAVQHDFDLT